MKWLLLLLIPLALIPKAPGVFGYWHGWRGVGVEFGIIVRVRCGFWSYDLLPGSLAERLAKVIDSWMA